MDTTFDSDGIVRTQAGDPAAPSSAANAVALQADGKIVAAGRADDANHDGVFAVVRYHADGSLDTSFDSDGIVRTQASDPAAMASAAYAVALQADGKIVAAGEADDASEEGVFGVVRYNANGSLDTSFDSDGIVRTQASERNRFSSARAVALQADGKIVATGIASDIDDQGVLGVVRYHADGSLDTSFDSDGIVRTQAGDPAASGASAVALQADGKIVAAGGARDADDDSVFAVVRYHADGSLDTSFGSDGIVRTQADDPAAPLSPFSIASAVALQADGKIVAAGNARSIHADDSVFAVVRYHADGSLDTSFDSDGIVRTQASDPAAPSRQSGARAVALQADGKIVVAGRALDGANNDFVFAVVRYEGDMISGPSCDCNAPEAIVGSEGRDKLVGTRGSDIICGLGGKDVLFGFGGEDCLDGGSGRDKLFGGRGDDVLRGGKGRDKLFGSRGDDLLLGGEGHDKLFGGRGNDVLRGGKGRDKLFGGRGNDQCDGAFSRGCEE